MARKELGSAENSLSSGLNTRLQALVSYCDTSNVGEIVVLVDDRLLALSTHVAILVNPCWFYERSIHRGVGRNLATIMHDVSV